MKKVMPFVLVAGALIFGVSGVRSHSLRHTKAKVNPDSKLQPSALTEATSAKARAPVEAITAENAKDLVTENSTPLEATEESRSQVHFDELPPKTSATHGFAKRPTLPWKETKKKPKHYLATLECPTADIPHLEVYYVRHAQSEANRVNDMTLEERQAAYPTDQQLSEAVCDAKLTDKGIGDASSASATLMDMLQGAHVDAVVVSSFQRTLQTAELITKGLRAAGQIGKILAVDELREGMHRKRLGKTELARKFPFVTDWSNMHEEDPAVCLYKEWAKASVVKIEGDDGDKLCASDHMEPEENLRRRQRRFLRKLMKSAKKHGWRRVVVVSHSKYGGSLLGRFTSKKDNGAQSRGLEGTVDYADPSLQKKLKNTEIRRFCLSETEYTRLSGYETT